MDQRHEEKKAELLREIEKLVDQLLEWDEVTPAPTLGQVEGKVLTLRQEVGRHVAEAVLAGQEENRPVPEPGCPKCGKRMRYKGQKEISIGSLVGQLRLERGYYWCEDCQEGFFPSGRTASDVCTGLE